MVMQINGDQIIEQSVLGEISAPRIPGTKWRVGSDGVARALPGVGGITPEIVDEDVNLASIPGIGTERPVEEA